LHVNTDGRLAEISIMKIQTLKTLGSKMHLGESASAKTLKFTRSILASLVTLELVLPPEKGADDAIPDHDRNLP
jgi:hypothetical protein